MTKQQLAQDNIVVCRHCKSDLCYETLDHNHLAWQCMDCGFYTNTMMLKNSEIVKHLMETEPELYKDIAYEDEDGFIWWPKTIISPKKYIIFANGKNKEDWFWTYAPEVEIPNEELTNYPLKKANGKRGGYMTHRVDMAQAKHFPKTDFIRALDVAGLIK